VHETQSEGHAKEIVNNLTHDTIEKTIISVGGDGTLCEVINGIDKFTNLTISLIPCGSGNDFVSATRIPTNPIKAIKFILNQRPRKINYINVNNNRAINVVGFGLDTEVLKFYYKLKIFTPKFRYKFATLVKTLFFK
jgi:diacylglycerol kinase family enzyme